MLQISAEHRHLRNTGTGQNGNNAPFAMMSSAGMKLVAIFTHPFMDTGMAMYSSQSPARTQNIHRQQWSMPVTASGQQLLSINDNPLREESKL